MGAQVLKYTSVKAEYTSVMYTRLSEYTSILRLVLSTWVLCIEYSTINNTSVFTFTSIRNTPQSITWVYVSMTTDYRIMTSKCFNYIKYMYIKSYVMT